MKILSLHLQVEKYLRKHKLEKKFEKQQRFLKQNPFHPSLKTELLEPRKLRIWSFRINQRYRAIFIFRQRDMVEILEVNNHYQ